MKSYTLANGIEIVNVTPHDLTFTTNPGGTLTESAPRSGAILSAAVTEEAVTENGIEFVRPAFVPSAEGDALLAEIASTFPGALIVAGLIAAQAYPGRVVSIVAAPGFERVPPAEKRMNPGRYTRY